MPSDDATLDRLGDLPSLRGLARRLIARRPRRGVTDREIAGACLGAGEVDPRLAETLARTLLGEDRRFVRTDRGRWKPAPGPATPAVDLSEARFCVVDVETTGTGPSHRIIEIGAAVVENLAVTRTFSTLVDPGVPVPPAVTALTGITTAMLEGAPGPGEALDALAGLMGESVFAAHNAPFDRRFVYGEMRAFCGAEPSNPVLCTRLLARRAVPDLGGYSLDRVARRLGYAIEARHRGLDDALAAAHVLLASVETLRARGVRTLDVLLRVQRKAEYDRFLRGRA